MNNDVSAREAIIDEYKGLIVEAASLPDRARRHDALMAATRILERLPISGELKQNSRALKHLFGESSDWVERTFMIADGREAVVTYIDGLVDKQLIEAHGVRPLLFREPSSPSEQRMDGVAAIQDQLIAETQLRTADAMSHVVDGILHGDAAIMIDGETTALLLGSRSFHSRSVDEPTTESVIRGPREGFTEALRTNTSLLRRRLRTPHLIFDNVRVGRLTRTDVVVCYIQGIAVGPIIDEVKRRIRRIDIDGIIDSATIEELIEDDPYSLFPQVIATERPDIVASNLLEGRVAVFVDGSPFVLIMPVTLWSLMQASEDYYNRFHIGTFLRWLRYGLAALALLGPALYVAVTTFHQEMLPTALLLTLAATREGIPFPSVVEAFIMEIMFEALREAGVRLPRNVGQAISIVGALVIGQAAVQAGLVSAPMVIIVASTGIASFTFPRYSLGIAVRLMRFPMILLASTFGLYGIVVGSLILLIHLSGLRSFGLPYLTPVAPTVAAGLKDALIRPPAWDRSTRPSLIAYLNPRRQGVRIKPGPAPWEREEDLAGDDS